MGVREEELERASGSLWNYFNLLAPANLKLQQWDVCRELRGVTRSHHTPAQESPGH